MSQEFENEFYKNFTTMEDIQKLMDRKPVSVHQDENGNPDGVLVQTLDERFVIELHDLDEGKDDFSFDTAQERLKELGKTTDERFVIELHDLDEGKDDFSFDTAQERLKELGKTTFNKKQGLILAAYIEEINAALVEAGGEPFAKGWYISGELYKPVGCADYDSYGSWFFNGDGGGFDYDGRYNGYFRCRPVLALNA